MRKQSEIPATQAAGPSSGVLFPSLELEFPDGQRAPLWDYRGRGPLVVFLHEAPACAACMARLEMLAAAHPGYRVMGARVLAVGAAAPPADLPYPVILDPAHRLAAALDLSLPALVVVGRTGEVWTTWSGSHEVLPALSDIESWLEYVLSECRECFCCDQVWPAEWVRGEPSSP